MKKILIVLTLAFITVIASACGDSGYTVPGIDGELTPSQFARNGSEDAKVVTIAQNNLDPEDFAYDYYKTCFEDGDVAHYIENLTTKTSTEIRDIGGTWFVTVREYVDGEEHDQQLAGSGMVYTQHIMDPDTGSLEKIQ